MKPCSPLVVYAGYVAVQLGFEFFVSSWLYSTGISQYRSEKLSLLLASGFLLLAHGLFLNQVQRKALFSQPSGNPARTLLPFSLALACAGTALAGVQVFLTAQFSEETARSSWNFAGQPGALGFHDEYFGSRSGWPSLMLFASTQFLALPLLEELYFKAIILERFLSRHSRTFAIVLTSLLFAIAHEKRQFISVFAFSVLTCLYYIYSKNIWILCSIHGVTNFLYWLYSGFGGISYLEAKNADALGEPSTWATELTVAVLSCIACYLLLLRTSSATPPAPAPAPSSPDQHPS